MAAIDTLVSCEACSGSTIRGLLSNSTAEPERRPLQAAQAEHRPLQVGHRPLQVGHRLPGAVHTHALAAHRPAEAVHNSNGDSFCPRHQQQLRNKVHIALNKRGTRRDRQHRPSENFRNVTNWTHGWPLPRCPEKNPGIRSLLPALRDVPKSKSVAIFRPVTPV